MDMKAKGMDQEFVDLVNRSQRLIQRVCRMYSDSAEDRRELFQETVYQLWRSFPSFQGKSSPKTWIYRVALNTAITTLRKEHRRLDSVPLEPYDQRNAAADETRNRNERSWMLEQAMRGLDRIERALVMLYLEDLSYKEMAEVLGLTETHVGVKLNRIKGKLQDTLREHE